MMMESTYSASRTFNIIRLLQQRESEEFLIKMGYAPEEIADAQKIRNYLFVCYENARLEKEWKK